MSEVATMYSQQLMPQITLQQQQDRHARTARQRLAAAAEASGEVPRTAALAFDSLRDFAASSILPHMRTAVRYVQRSAPRTSQVTST